MKLFVDLSQEEEQSFRQWARENYTAFTPIDGLWHPVIQDECRLINSSTELKYQEEAEYEVEVVDLFMTYDCEDPADLKVIKRKLKELN